MLLFGPNFGSKNVGRLGTQGPLDVRLLWITAVTLNGLDVKTECRRDYLENLLLNKRWKAGGK